MLSKPGTGRSAARLPTGFLPRTPAAVFRAVMVTLSTNSNKRMGVVRTIPQPSTTTIIRRFFELRFIDTPAVTQERPITGNVLEKYNRTARSVKLTSVVLQNNYKKAREVLVVS